MSVNKVILLGRLGKDPQLKYIPGGPAVCEFVLATSETYKDKSGQKQERTEWHPIVVYGKLAELCNQYLSKGRQAYVEGKLQTKSWDDKKDGSKRYKTEINANTVQFLNGSEKKESKPTNQIESLMDTAKEMFKANKETQFTTDEIPF